VRVIVLSPPERAALGVALILLVLHALAPGEALEYRRSALASEPWRALTGHLVHVSWPHALVNAAALWVVARLYAVDLDARRQLAALALSALAVSAALAWAHPSIAWYRGLSGALHGLFFAGATKWLFAERPRRWQRLWMPAALFAGGWIKVIVEQPDGSATSHADWLGAAVVPQAHLAGALCGSVLGVLFAATQTRAEQQRAEQ
jgi:rhomboid family GlyGly-CTERM serine protease